MRIPIPLAAAVLALAAGQARAATIDVSSTTMLQLGEQTRGGVPLAEPELATVSPLFEILSISATNLVNNRIVNDLSFAVSTWGSYDLQDMRWDNGTSSELTGDVMTGYVQGRLFHHWLTLRLGRAHMMAGAGRMLHLDGGEVGVNFPFGLRLSGYAGAPVAQRFASRRTFVSWNPTGGDLAYGGRAQLSFPMTGFPGRGLDLGASANFVMDGDESVREEVAADVRLQPFSDDLTLSGVASWSLYDERISEIAARADWSATRRLAVDLEGRYFAPDLFLARNSILSVFSSEDRAVFGGGFGYELGKGLEVGAHYRLSVEPGEEETDDDYLGHEAEAILDWERGHTRAGAEVLFLDALENGYVALRLFGRQDLGPFFASADVLGHLFREDVNGEDVAVTGTLTAGYELVKGFSAVVSGRAGMTPFLEQTYDVMAKLVYNSTYRIREVR